MISPLTDEQLGAQDRLFMFAKTQTPCVARRLNRFKSILIGVWHIALPRQSSFDFQLE